MHQRAFQGIAYVRAVVGVIPLSFFAERIVSKFQSSSKPKKFNFLTLRSFWLVILCDICQTVVARLWLAIKGVAIEKW